MQDSVPGDTGGAERPEGDSTEPGGDRVRQDWRARHFKRASHRHAAGDPSEGGAHDGGHGGAHDGGTPAERLGRQAWAWVRELLTIIVIAVVLSFLIKTFLFRAFFIPSGSMENTLQIQDRIFVNLLVPEPFALKRGDVVVFKDTQGWLPPEPASDNPVSWIGEVATFIGLAPDNSQQHLVKRVIGMPGDKVACCTADGKLTVNGQPIDEPYLYPGAAPSDTTFEVTVPEGHLWVMGDHRNNSQDSRYHNSFDGTGFVPIDDVEGRAVVIAWPVTHWGILGNYPDVFKDVPAPQNSSVSSGQHAPAGQ